MPSGGARQGAGRPLKPTIFVRKAQAEEILGSVDEIDLWKGLLRSENLRIRLESLKYLTDRRDGKAPQAVPEPEVMGVIIRDVSWPYDDDDESMSFQ